MKKEKEDPIDISADIIISLGTKEYEIIKLAAINRKLSENKKEK